MSRIKSLLAILIIVLLAVFAGWLVLTDSFSTLLQQMQKTQLIIHWTTENELDIVGFNLYRSDSPVGQFVKINQELIPPAPAPVIGGEHTFVDEDVIRGRTYYYQLETVLRHGTTKVEGPFAISAD